MQLGYVGSCYPQLATAANMMIRAGGHPLPRRPEVDQDFSAIKLLALLGCSRVFTRQERNPCRACEFL
jgi:hypothetical protein